MENHKEIMPQVEEFMLENLQAIFRGDMTSTKIKTDNKQYTVDFRLQNGGVLVRVSVDEEEEQSTEENIVRRKLAEMEERCRQRLDILESIGALKIYRMQGRIIKREIDYIALARKITDTKEEIEKLNKKKTEQEKLLKSLEEIFDGGLKR